MPQDEDRTDIPRPGRSGSTEPQPERVQPSDAEPPQHSDEVRAGPGDAGRSDRPEPLPETRNESRRGRQALWLFLILAALAILLIALA